MVPIKDLKESNLIETIFTFYLRGGKVDVQVHIGMGQQKKWGGGIFIFLSDSYNNKVFPQNLQFDLCHPPIRHERVSLLKHFKGVSYWTQQIFKTFTSCPCQIVGVGLIVGVREICLNCWKGWVVFRLIFYKRGTLSEVGGNMWFAARTDFKTHVELGTEE